MATFKEVVDAKIAALRAQADAEQAAHDAHIAAANDLEARFAGVQTAAQQLDVELLATVQGFEALVYPTPGLVAVENAAANG